MRPHAQRRARLTNRLRQLGAPGLPRVAPSLLAADFARLEAQVRAVEDAGADILHLDVMDGHFVPNISFGVPVIESLRPHSPMLFDAHLMIEEPQRYLQAFAQAGCDHITFQIEAMLPPAVPAPVSPPGRATGRTLAPDAFDEAGHRAGELVDRLHAMGVSAGICLNPATPVEPLHPVLARVDMVLVMSVWPGFGGQAFMPEVLPKVMQLRSLLHGDQRLEIDGGIAAPTIGLAVHAGADTLVAGSAVFGQEDPAAAWTKLERLARQAAGA